MWFQCRPLPEQSPLIYREPYKFWYTWEVSKYDYTYTEMPDDVAQEMMQTYTYRQVWRPNGYVVPFYPNFKNDKMVEFFDKQGNFIYYMLEKADDVDKFEKSMLEALKKEDLKIDDEVLEEVKAEKDKIESKQKKKRTRKKKSD